MKRWTVSLAIAFILFLFHSPVFSKSIVEIDSQGPAKASLGLDSKIVSGLDTNWKATPSPFLKEPGGFTLKIGNGHHGNIVFPTILDSQNPIVIQIQKNKVQQVLASGGSYKAELVGKYLVYRGEKNSILYRYDADKQSLREFVYLKEASALAKSGDVIQWRFEGADLKLQDNGSVTLTQTIDIKNEVRKVSNNHMADRISRFLAKKRNTPEEPGSQTHTLFTIPKPEYIDGHGKTLTQGIQYKVADAKLTLHLNPKAKLTYPLWVDPTLVFKSDEYADLIIQGQEGGWFGFNVASAGDFNGDGLDDIIVAGFVHDNNGLANSGSAYIFFGRNSSGQANLQSHLDADVILNGNKANKFFGRSVASAGDFNGDGLDDVIVGTFWEDNNGLDKSGSAFIFFGRNPTNQLILQSNPDADVIINGQDAEDFLGLSVDSAGDFNGDGLDDVIVGATGNDNNGLDRSGSAFIFFGRSSTTQLNLISDADADIILNGQSELDGFGSPVSSAGDFNGDGLDDVIVVAGGDDNSGTDSGRAFIFFGHAPSSQVSLRADADADIIIDGPSVDMAFGNAVNSAGDFNGDGLNDIIIGERLYATNELVGAGRAFIFFGRNPASQILLQAEPDANVILQGEHEHNLFGQCISTAGDFNGDGMDDVLVGQGVDTTGLLKSTGSARIFFGREATTQIFLGATTDADIIIDGQTESAHFGFSASPGMGLASIGDFNGDGLGDFVAGAFAVDNGGSSLGSAYIFFGKDTSIPIITLFGGDPATAQFGSTSFSFGATAQDFVDGDITANIVESPLDTNILGPQTITYDVVNSRGFAAHAERTVNVIDTTPPALTLIGNSTILINIGTTYTDQGATALDNFDGDVTANIVVGGLPVDTSALGSHIITYDVTDSFGNAAHTERVVSVVVDATAPLITIRGLNPGIASFGWPYFDFGATAYDNTDGDLTNSIVVGGLPLDTNVVGTHIVTYDVTNSLGKTFHAERTVNVVDFTPPVITILGSNPDSVNIGEAYVDAGATALDDADGDVTANIVVTGLPIDTSFPGTHYITYSISDSSGNSAQETRVVDVTPDMSPVITVWGDNPVTVEAGDPYYDNGASAVDYYGSSISYLIITGGLPIDTSIPSSHIVTYDVTDFYGNTAHAERIVNVVDTTPPVVTPPADVTTGATGTTTPVAIGTATATDNVAVASITSDAPASFPAGTTVVTWTATDSSGNTGTAIQNVTIVLILPVITPPDDVLVDSTEALTTVNIGTATATDDLGISSITNDAPAQFPQGITVVTWTATNTSGNTAITTQSVRVQQPLLPIAQWDGQNAFASLGRAFASAGDFNGDGFEDIIVGDPSDENQEGIASGRAFIYFGPNGPSPVDPNPEVNADIILEGQDSGDNFGVSPASIGDFNGDGIDDIIVGALLDDANGITNSGSAFIFFGRNTTGPLNLRADADADIILQGHIPNEFLGLGSSPAGDFNGDGLDDIIVGAINNSNNGLHHSGSAYILFGRDTTSQLVLLAHTDADVTLDGQNTLDVFGDSVASAGDFNGDGLGDVIVGAPWDDNNGKSTSGSAFIFFGRSTTGPLNLRADADADIILNGSLDNSFLGDLVAFAGDFNGDGLDDVIIGAHSELPSSGSAFILFGRSITSQLILQANIDADLIIDGQGEDDRFGNSVASAGDFNGDGFDDVIVGARLDDNNEKSASGSAFIFLGRNTTGQLNLRADIDADFVFNGGNTGDQLSIVASAGDFDGDGIDDVFAGAGGASNNGLISSGSAFIFPGNNPDAPIITVLGDNPASVDLGTTYVDAGATASDVEDGDITANITVSGLPVDTSVLGTRTITYQVTDSSGNSAQAVRTVTVRTNTIPPILTMLGSNPVTIEAHTSYTDAGATALDDVDGDLTTSIVVGGLPINTDVLGTHIITYDVTDSAGNSVHTERTVNVVDTIPPSITLFGLNPVTVGFGITFIDPGAIATDHIFGDLTASIVVGGLPVDTSVLGIHTITYDVTDSAGNTAHEERILNVVDILPPVITLLGTTPATVELGSTYVDAGATASDTFDGNLTASIIIGGLPINTSVLGTHTITYNVTDSSGNAATQVTRTVNVVDTTAPVITLLGTSSVTVEFGSTYTDAGATASDNVDGDLTISIIAGGLPIDTSVLGSHTVTYNVTDSSGNAATQVTRTVNVVDTTAPVITLLGTSSVTVEFGSTYTDAGATASDNMDGDLTTSIVVGGLPINTNVTGTHTVTYNVTDASGNAAAQVTRTVNVVDTTSPVVTAPANVTVEATGTTTPVSIGTATATDNVAVVSITSNAPATFPVGLTVVTWTATDASGNTGTATQNITVQDTTLPVVTAPADVTAEATGATTSVAIGTATAKDNVSVASVTSNAPVSFPLGLTVVTWTATDTSGNSGTATQNVTVQDTTAPVITLLGNSPVTVNAGDTYTDAGATASDTVDGNLTASIVVGGLPINTSVAGTYTVTYNVTDSAGNAATQVTRTVNVTAPQPPVTLSVVNLFDNKNGKNYFPGGPEGTDPLDDINSPGEDGKVEVLGDDSSGWWEAQFADPDPALGNPSEVLVTVNYRPESDWTGTFTVQYRVGSTVLASTTIPGNSSGNAVTFTWDLSSVVTTSGDLANGRLRFLNNDPSNGKKVFISFSSTTATLGN